MIISLSTFIETLSVSLHFPLLSFTENSTMCVPSLSKVYVNRSLSLTFTPFIIQLYSSIEPSESSPLPMNSALSPTLTVKSFSGLIISAAGTLFIFSLTIIFTFSLSIPFLPSSTWKFTE